MQRTDGLFHSSPPLFCICSHERRSGNLQSMVYIVSSTNTPYSAPAAWRQGSRRVQSRDAKPMAVGVGRGGFAKYWKTPLFGRMSRGQLNRVTPRGPMDTNTQALTPSCSPSERQAPHLDFRIPDGVDKDTGLLLADVSKGPAVNLFTSQSAWLGLAKPYCSAMDFASEGPRMPCFFWPTYQKGVRSRIRFALQRSL